jgi:hypothetical protein
MKSLAIVCLLATTLPLLPGPGSVPLEVRIDIKPRMSGGVIPVRTMPYHATATVSEAGERRVIGKVDIDLEPGKSQTREESVAGYRITFQSKIASDGLRAAAVATVWKGEQIVTRQSSDVSFAR